MSRTGIPYCNCDASVVASGCVPVASRIEWINGLEWFLRRCIEQSLRVKTLRASISQSSREQHADYLAARREGPLPPKANLLTTAKNNDNKANSKRKRDADKQSKEAKPRKNNKTAATTESLTLTAVSEWLHSRVSARAADMTGCTAEENVVVYTVGKDAR